MLRESGEEFLIFTSGAGREILYNLSRRARASARLAFLA